MKTYFSTILAIIMINQNLLAISIQLTEYVDKIKNATPKERRVLINEFKLHLKNLKADIREEDIEKFKEFFSKKNQIKIKTREHIIKQKQIFCSHQIVNKNRYLKNKKHTKISKKRYKK